MSNHVNTCQIGGDSSHTLQQRKSSDAATFCLYELTVANELLVISNYNIFHMLHLL